MLGLGLNIPMADGKSADWHFTSVWFSERGKFRVAGKDTADSIPIFGDYGIRECGQILRDHGVPLNADDVVYAADFVRAILDLLYDNIVQGYVPLHLSLDEFLDDPKDQDQFWQQYQKLKSFCSDSKQRQLLEAWEKTAHNGHH